LRRGKDEEALLDLGRDPDAELPTSTPASSAGDRAEREAAEAQLAEQVADPDRQEEGDLACLRTRPPASRS
jgi:hypothetical protein